MSSYDLSVIAPCLDESLNIPELVRRVLKVFERGGLKGELILVDDGSTDGSVELIKKLAQENPESLVGVYHPENRGISQGWQSGVDAARAQVVAVIDADLQYQPEDLLRLYRTLIENSLDVVQGWRSAVGREKGSRYHVSRTFNTLLNKTFGMDLQDNKSGYVMAPKEVFEDLLTYSGNYRYWQSFVMVAAHAKGYSYKEVETLFEKRRQGESFLTGTTLSASMSSIVDLGKAAWEYRVKRGKATVSEQFLNKHPVEDSPKPRSLSNSVRWRTYMGTFDQTHWMITKNVENYYDSLRKTQWLSVDHVRELQDEKLRRLVRHAYRNVPYYRAQMQAMGLSPLDIRGQGDLHKLPLLAKDDVRNHLYFDILSENHDKSQVLKITTSGSTGQPFVCYADRAQLEFRWAATLRSQEWTGYEFGDPCVRLWHQTIGMSKSQAIREKLDALMVRRKYIPVFEMSDESLRSMVREIAEWQPTMLDGYAEALDFLARYLKSHGDVPVRPKSIMSSAQTLPAGSRKVMEEAFGCKVFDKYGAREFSGIAYECEHHNGHHVVAEGFIVEILRNGVPVKPGETGEVVITDLNNFSLPFIRYRIGDLAVAKDPKEVCSCGRGLPLIGDIEGRVQSIIQGTDGRYLPGTFFAHYLKEFDYAIERFQIVQEKPRCMVFKVVKGGRYSDDVLQQILATFRDYLGQDMGIEVEFVDGIDLIRTGKHLASVSKLSLDFQGAAPSKVNLGAGV